jgi:ABC-type branched-subunit amino acid transport system substrate-binding protein
VTIARALVLVAGLLIVSCTRTPPVVVPSPTPETGVLEVTALLDLSGSRAPRGDPQRNALQLWSDLDQSRGGGRVPVRVKVVDVGGSDARLLVELRRAAEEDRADAVIVGVPVSFATATFAQGARAAALPVVLTLPVPDPVAQPGGRWIFALAPTPEQIARRVAEAPAEGEARLTAILAAPGKPLDSEAAALGGAYVRLGVPEPVVVRPDPEQPIAAVRFLSAARRVHVSGPPREWSAVAQSLKQTPRGPTYVLSYFTDPADLGEFREGLDAVWPAPLLLTASAVPPNAAATSRRQFIRSFGDRHGPPTAHAAAAYDALSLLALAAERVGADDRERLREQLEVTAFAGVASTYALSVTRHAAYADNDLALYRWTGSAPALDLRPR